VPRAGERQRFVQALLREIAIAGDELNFFARPVKTVYFGGGTPSLHPPEEIGTLLRRVNDVYGIDSCAEITLEANPGTLNAELLNGWHEAGVNRLSIGAQSFSARKLKLLYRDHTAEDIPEAVKLARAEGFDNISLDLIFGLPEESLSEWESDLASATALDPEHISLYNLEFHEGTPFERWRAQGRLVPLAEDAEADLYLFTHEYFTHRGYEHYEVSNYAKPGRRAVHNSAYWESKPYLGLGPSAHSFDGDSLRFFNKADLHAYFADIEENHLPIGGRQVMDASEQIEEWISLSLRRSNGIRYESAKARLGEKTARALWERATELPASLRVVNEDILLLTAEGWFRENSVLLFLFDALKRRTL